MSKRIMTFVTAFSIAGFMLFALAVNATVASAVAVVNNGVGYRTPDPDPWWIGSYELEDGSRGFCLQAGRAWPVHHEVDFVDGSELNWFAPADSARLAYIARTWAATEDPLTAASGQLATWMIAGLGDHPAEFYAARAGDDAGAVLARAHEMVAEATREATIGVDAELIVELSEEGPGRLRTELVADRPSDGKSLVPQGRHRAEVELVGGTFEDGSTVAEIENGTDVEITPTGDSPTVEIAAEVRFSELPFGDRLTIAVPRDDVQALLIATPAAATAHAKVQQTGPSPLPFQPIVETKTSSPVAAPGASIDDLLIVGVAVDDGLLPTWGVYTDEESGLRPIAVTVESTLLGPFDAPLERTSEIPAGAPVVCTVEVPVEGPGEYRTPECTLPSPGHYVWVERIDPTRVPDEQGGSRLRPWQSDFGIASETTIVKAAAASAAVAMLADTGAETSWVPITATIGVVLLGVDLLILDRVARRRGTRSLFR